MRLGVNASFVGRMPVKELARKISDKGFDNVQLSLSDAISDIDTDLGRLSPGMANYIGEVFYKQGIQIAVLECFVNPVLPDESIRRRQLDIVKDRIRLARDFGCSVVSTETGSLNADFSYNKENRSERTFQILLQSLDEIVNEAEKYGVMVCIEECSSFVAHNPEKIKRILDEIDSGNLQVLFDPVDLLIDCYKDHEQDIQQSFELFGDRIMAVHAKDFTVENNCFKMVQAGKGMLDYSLLFNLLKERKPYINIIMEETSMETIDEGIRFLKDAYQRA